MPVRTVLLPLASSRCPSTQPPSPFSRERSCAWASVILLSGLAVQFMDDLVAVLQGIMHGRHLMHNDPVLVEMTQSGEWHNTRQSEAGKAGMAACVSCPDSHLARRGGRA